MKRYYWQLSTVLLSLSVVLAVVIAYQMGLIGYTRLDAADEMPASGEADTSPKDLELRERERIVSERESLVKDQLIRYEKVVEDLRAKLKAKGDELNAKLKAKEDEIKSKVGAKDEDYKRTAAIKEDEYKRQLAKRDEELKRKGIEIEQLKDKRAETYRGAYAKMEPKKAAKILDEMEIVLASQILGDIKEQQAAEILSKMSPERARLITERNLGKRPLASLPMDTKTNSQPVNAAQENNPLAPIRP